MVDSELMEDLVKGLDYSTIHDDVEESKKIILSRTVSPVLPDYVEERINQTWVESIMLHPLRDEEKIGVDLSKIVSYEDSLLVSLYLTSYRYYVGTCKNQIPGHIIHMIGSGGITLLKSEDGESVLFGKRSRDSADVGGGIEVLPQGLVDGRDFNNDNLFEDTIIRECREEIYSPLGLKLNPNDISIKRMSFVKTDYGACAVMDYLLKIDDNLLAEKFNKKDEKMFTKLLPTRPSEHSEFYSVPKKNLEEFIKGKIHAKENGERLGIATRYRLRNFLLHKEEL